MILPGVAPFRVEKRKNHFPNDGKWLLVEGKRDLAGKVLFSVPQCDNRENVEGEKRNQNSGFREILAFFVL